MVSSLLKDLEQFGTIKPKFRVEIGISLTSLTTRSPYGDNTSFQDGGPQDFPLTTPEGEWNTCRSSTTKGVRGEEEEKLLFS